MEISDLLWRKLHIFQLMTKSKFLGTWQCYVPTDISLTRDIFFSINVCIYLEYVGFALETQHPFAD